ncbi:hypothetical protein EDB92DRAFT_1814706 [Lactarius akahatsu]|uniref:Uncharacterized protein n=1 Tax=Lactarius akahatsu TaxID=416441 RepID=A0AAD4LLY7_9AGAM|nr:hypothetical protein EDB92DRAFT_1814706 [Lactarius akahatsu]
MSHSGLSCSSRKGPDDARVWVQERGELRSSPISQTPRPRSLAARTRRVQKSWVITDVNAAGSESPAASMWMSRSNTLSSLATLEGRSQGTTQAAPHRTVRSLRCSALETPCHTRGGRGGQIDRPMDGLEVRLDHAQDVHRDVQGIWNVKRSESDLGFLSPLFSSSAIFVFAFLFKGCNGVGVIKRRRGRRNHGMPLDDKPLSDRGR